MTEETQQSTTRKPNRDDVSFWSPWEIFFLGVYPAALSWWRMGNKRKAKIFLVISAILLLLREWVTVRNSLVYLELMPIVLVVTFAIFGIFQMVLATSIKDDAREFRLILNKIFMFLNSRLPSRLLINLSLMILGR